MGSCHVQQRSRHSPVPCCGGGRAQVPSVAGPAGCSGLMRLRSGIQRCPLPPCQAEKCSLWRRSAEGGQIQTSAWHFPNVNSAYNNLSDTWLKGSCMKVNSTGNPLLTNSEQLEKSSEDMVLVQLIMTRKSHVWLYIYILRSNISLIFTKSLQTFAAIWPSRESMFLWLGTLTQLAVFAHIRRTAVAFEISFQVPAGASILTWLAGTVVYIYREINPMITVFNINSSPVNFNHPVWT